MKVTIDRYEMENVELVRNKKSLSSQPSSIEKSGGASSSSPAIPVSKRRLLITTDNFLPRWDGISRFLSEIIPRLKQDYDITVVAPYYGEIAIDGVQVVQIPVMKRSFGDYIPATFQYRRIALLVRRSDIVFNQALGSIGVCAILAAKRHRRPIANYIHSVDWELASKALARPAFRGPIIPVAKLSARFFYNKCSVLIVPSEHTAELFSWQKITTPKRVVHLGVDTNKFLPADKVKAREQLQLPSDAFIVGYHGRIGYEKNLLTLLRAFRRLPIAKKRLIIVGDGVPRLKDKLTKFTDVMVTGSTNHVVPWLQAMDVYVQPSFTETTSLGVLEAMSCSLAVISSKVGFIQQYIYDGDNGLFFDNLSAYDLSKKIMLLHNDPVLRATLGVAARKTVVERFNWERTASGIKQVLDDL